MKNTTSIESGYLCHCFRITAERFDSILNDESAPTYPLLKEKYCIGTKCSSCEYEAKGVLSEYLLLNPKKRSAQKGKSPTGLRADLGFAWKQLREKFGPPPAPKKKKKPAEAEPKIYHTGIFFMRKHGLESRLVVSNLRFPEHAQNQNGASATFRAQLFGEDGTELAVSEPVTVADGESLELTPGELFPKVTGDFVGGLYVTYDAIMQTGSLRPYGVMVSTNGDISARCHYHDKFGVTDIPGFVQTASPCEPGQTCWMALSNCQNRHYSGNARIRFGDARFSTPIEVPAMASRWIKINDLFPKADVPFEKRSPGLFWLDNPQRVMVYFFWYNEADRTWMAQHH